MLITVERVRGCSGAVSCAYTTKDGTALAEHNYTATSGTLEWPKGDVAPKTIEIAITDDTLLQGTQYFDIVLSDATGGATFDANTDGKVEASYARVTIEDDEKMVTLAEKTVRARSAFRTSRSASGPTAGRSSSSMHSASTGRTRTALSRRHSSG